MTIQRSAKRSALPWTEPPRQAIARPFRPHMVYSRDDSLDAGTRPDEPTKVLIVEDDYLVGAQVESALTDAGFAVAGVVSSAEEAIEVAETGGVALVIMDVRLAGPRDGVDAAIELFQRHGIRSIFATAHADAETRRRAEGAQPLGWLQKPYSMSSLVTAVRAAATPRPN